jgi:hypothetical protein
MAFRFPPRPGFKQPGFCLRRNRCAQDGFDVRFAHEGVTDRLPPQRLRMLEGLRFSQHGIAQTRGGLENTSAPRGAAFGFDLARGPAYPGRHRRRRVESRNGPEHGAQLVLAGDETFGHVHSACPNSRRRRANA